MFGKLGLGGVDLSCGLDGSSGAAIRERSTVTWVRGLARLRHVT
jgi:hypothetical protein